MSRKRFTPAQIIGKLREAEVALAIGYAPACLTEKADGIRQDWPRIPLPDTREVLEHSACLGRSLTIEEAREVTGMACRLAAIILMEPALNANYLRAKEYSFR